MSYKGSTRHDHGDTGSGAAQRDVPFSVVQQARYWWEKERQANTYERILERLRDECGVVVSMRCLRQWLGYVTRNKR